MLENMLNRNKFFRISTGYMILAILQARVSSTRLPGKVLKPILGKPMLQQQVERVLRSKKIDRLVVATSTEQDDDPLVPLCESLGIESYRGSLTNVIDRFYQAALIYEPAHVVRLTGDCPLIDPQMIDDVIAFYLNNDYDYASNSLHSTFPDGLDVEIFRFSVLKKAWLETSLPSEKEHVTLHIYKHPERYRLGSFEGTPDLSGHRWTVDEPEDFVFVSTVFEELYPHTPCFSTKDILKLLDARPELVSINRNFTRNSGLQKSILADKKQDPMQKRSKSLAMQERARQIIPGISQLLSKRPDQFSYGVWPGYFSRAKGAEVWDLDDNRYIDMSIGGIGATVLGYADPDVDNAVRNAIDQGVSSSLNCPEEVTLAELLCELHPWAKKVRYARSGGEAVAIAVRIARAHTGRDKIAFCGYHGWHDWYLAANIGTENALGEHLLSGLKPTGVPRGLKGTAFPFRYNHLEELQAIFREHAGELAAIVMEPIRNDHPSPEFIAGIQKLARENGVALIVDEISAGFRLNSGGAHLVLNIEPDIAVFSKAIGNGYPIAAIIGKADIMETAQDSFISSTNWTERTGPAAAIATIQKHRRLDVGRHLVEIGEMVQHIWQESGQKHNLDLDIGGIPPLSHFSFKHPQALSMKAYFIQLMLEEGVLASTSFYAMFAHRKEHVEAYQKGVDGAFHEVAQAVKNGNIAGLLIGQPSAAGFGRII